jgi:hypothetical protein
MFMVANLRSLRIVEMYATRTQEQNMVAAVAPHASTMIAALTNPAPLPFRAVQAPTRADWIELDAAHVALRAATNRTVTLIRSISDPSLQIAGSHRSLGDAAAHLVLTAQIAVDCFAGFPSPIHDLSAKRSFDARFLAQFPERRPEQLAELLQDAVDLLIDAPLDGDLIPFHSGIPLEPGVILGLLVADMMALGWDIARTLGLHWSTEIATARVAASATIRMLPFVLAESAAQTSASFRVHIRGGDAITGRIGNGKMSVSRTDLEPVDCHISADPVAFVLVAHRRLSRIGRVARGQLLSWGENKGFGATLPTLFTRP